MSALETPEKAVFGDPNSADYLKSLHDAYKNIEMGMNPDSGIDPNTLGERVKKCKNVRKQMSLTTKEDWKAYRKLCGGIITSANNVISKMKTLDEQTGHVKKDKFDRPVVVSEVDEHGRSVQRQVPRHAAKIKQFFEIITDCQEQFDEATLKIKQLTEGKMVDGEGVQKHILFEQEDVVNFLFTVCPLTL